MHHTTEGPLPCLACLAASPLATSTPERWTLAARLPGLADEEGARLALDLPPVIDGHVHLFPERLYEAIWRWFDAYGWPIRYKLYAEQVIAFQRARGVRRIVGLQYAHRPGMARELNAWLAGLCAAHPDVAGAAAVFPGEPGAREILADAFASGLRGVKLHCHVQGLPIDSPEMMDILAFCAEQGQPVLVHAGREPRSPAYPVDPWAVCHVSRVARVLADLPRLRLCVPHLGADEFEAYIQLIERVDNLWLDTTMAVAGYLPGADGVLGLAQRARPDRVFFGTDFPNIPYAWDREVRRLAGALRGDHLAAVLGGNAADFWGIPLS